MHASFEGNNSVVLNLLASEETVARINCFDKVQLYLISWQNNFTSTCVLFVLLNQEGDTSLIIAASQGHTHIVPELLLCGAHINASNKVMILYPFLSMQ